MNKRQAFATSDPCTINHCKHREPELHFGGVYIYLVEKPFPVQCRQDESLQKYR